MSDERLERCRRLATLGGANLAEAVWVLQDLLVEVDRLRARVANLEALVVELAGSGRDDGEVMCDG